MLTVSDLEKYHHHINLNSIGYSGQLKIKRAKVLIIGLGGLGTPIALYLANAGIGQLGLVDGDQIEISNLPRQVLYSDSDQKKCKTLVSAEKLKKINPNLKIESYTSYLKKNNASEIMKNYDIILDCTDNFKTSYLINETSRHLNKASITASLLQFKAILAIFSGQTGPCYQCLFQINSNLEAINCTESGVLNTFVGYVALLQAHETLKLILNLKPSSKGQLFYINGLTLSIKKFKISQDPNCPICTVKPF